MQANYDILSTRAEASIKSMLVSAVQASGTSASTKRAGLIGCENAAMLCEMTRPQFLCLAIYTDLQTTIRDIQELQEFLLTDVIMQQPWYTKGDYFKSEKHQRRINGLNLSAIMFLSPCKNHHPTTVEIARNMGLSVSAYNKTWASRMAPLKTYLTHNLNVAAQVVHHNSANG